MCRTVPVTELPMRGGRSSRCFYSIAPFRGESYCQLVSNAPDCLTRALGLSVGLENAFLRAHGR